MDVVPDLSTARACVFQNRHGRYAWSSVLIIREIIIKNERPRQRSVPLVSGMYV